MPSYVLAIVVLALFVVPFLLGNYFAKMLRMPDYGWKIGLILWVTLCSVDDSGDAMAAEIGYRS